MKTNFRILTTVFTLAFVGVLNANPTVNFGEKNSGLFPGNENVSVLNENTASFESELNESIDYGMEAQLITHMIADMAEAKATQEVMERGFVTPNETFNSVENEVVTENSNETIDFGKEAQLITKLIADMAEAKAAQRVMEIGFVAPQETTNSVENEIATENNDATIDFGKEAQLMIKLVADQAEAKAVQRVMERGFVTPQETTNSVENEIATESNDATIDFGKEALLITKLIADQEEAKAVQRVMERGFVTPNETTSSFENEVATETADFGKEALLITKLIADQEEAKAVQELIAEGIIQENK
jgi:hypothetical protein